MVGKWVPASAGKAKAGMDRFVSWCTRGVQVKLWDPLRMRAIPERLIGMFTTRRYTNPRLPFFYLFVAALCAWIRLWAELKFLQNAVLRWSYACLEGIINFYGIFVWRRYNSTILKKFEAAYIKCVKMFFGYDCRYSVTVMLMDLQLPTLSTIQVLWVWPCYFCSSVCSLCLLFIQLSYVLARFVYLSVCFFCSYRRLHACCKYIHTYHT